MRLYCPQAPGKTASGACALGLISLLYGLTLYLPCCGLLQARLWSGNDERVADGGRAGRGRGVDRISARVLDSPPAPGGKAAWGERPHLADLHGPDSAGGDPGGGGPLLPTPAQGAADAEQRPTIPTFRPIGADRLRARRHHRGGPAQEDHRRLFRERRSDLLGPADRRDRAAADRPLPAQAQTPGRDPLSVSDVARHRLLPMPVDHPGNVALGSDHRRRPAAAGGQAFGGRILILPGHPGHDRRLRRAAMVGAT